MVNPLPNESDEGRQLTLLVDGIPLRGDTSTSYTVQAALASLDSGQHGLIAGLRDRIGPEIGVIDSHFDDASMIFHHLGFRIRHVAGEDLAGTDLRVVALSCPHRHARLDDIDMFRFLQRGGLLLSSDRAIQLPGIARFIDHLPGRPPARARLESDAPEDLATAPVWLDPGHRPVDASTLDRCGGEAVARDALTGDPVVVLVPARGGGILHSVAHWAQAPHPEQLTSVERRPLRDVAAFRSIGNSFPGLTLGGFLAQRAMLRLLIGGMARLLEIEHAGDRARAGLGG